MKQREEVDQEGKVIILFHINKNILDNTVKCILSIFIQKYGITPIPSFFLCTKKDAGGQKVVNHSKSHSKLLVELGLGQSF